MENYLFYDNLVVKITNPDNDFPVSDEGLKRLNFIYSRMPTLLVFTEEGQLDILEPFINEVTADYIHNEKVLAYLIDGKKANFLSNSQFNKLPEALIIYPTPGYCYLQLFSSFSGGAEMKKDRFKTWFDSQMNFIVRRYGKLIYTEEYIPRVDYFVLENHKNERKIWPTYRDIPEGWTNLCDSYIASIGSKQEAIETVKKLNEQGSDEGNFENQEEDFEEAYRKALEQENAEYMKRMNSRI